MFVINGQYKEPIEKVSNCSSVHTCPYYAPWLMEKVLWSIDNTSLEETELETFRDLLQWTITNVIEEDFSFSASEFADIIELHAYIANYLF